MTVAESSSGATQLRSWRVGLFLVALFVAALTLRFWHLDERGLFGSDVVYYTNLAELWSEGERVYSLGGRRDVYRPVVLGLFAASIDVLGFEDDSIKKLNAGLDGLNILLVFALGFVISGRRLLPASLAAGLYAALPLVIYVSRTELTHTISIFFVVLMVLLAALWFPRRGSRGGAFWLIGSGASAAAASLSHEDLLFAAAGLGLWLIVAAGRRGAGWPERSRAAVMALALFFLPLGIGVSGMVVHHWEHARSLLSSWLTEGPSGGAEAIAGEGSDGIGPAKKIAGQVEKTFRLGWNGTVATSSVLVGHLMWLTLLCFLLDATRAWRKKEIFQPPTLEALPLAVTAGFLGLFALFFPYLFPRLFLPFIPLLLVFLTVVGVQAMELWRPRARLAVVMVLTLALLTMNVEQFSRRQSFMARDYSSVWVPLGPPSPFDLSAALAELKETSYRKSWARKVFERMADRVDEDSRMLVTSSLVYPHPARRELQTGYYFGDNAVYLFDHERPLEELVEELDIRWVLYTSYRADRRFLKKDEVRRYLGQGRWSEPGPTTLGQSLGIERQAFHLGTEYRALMSFLESQGAQLIHSTGMFSIGEPPSFAWADESYVIYELPRATR